MSCPKILRPLWNAWMKFSHVLGMIMSTLILTILWIVAFGLYAIVLRLISFPKLFRKKPNSYWITAKPTPMEEMRYPF